MIKLTSDATGRAGAALPTHPRTGLTAIGYRKSGAPIWPIMGGSQPTGGEPAPAPAPPTPVPAPAPAPAPPAPTPAPAPAPAPTGGAFDPATLSPEAQAYLKARIAEADKKSRTTSKENAAAQARDDLLKTMAEALDMKPKEVDPAEVGRQLAAAQAETKALKVQAAVSAQARAQGADEALLTAVLAHGGKLAGLDPAGATFDADVTKLVTDAVAANPKLKLDVTPAPGAQGAVGNFNGGGGNKFAGMSISGAVADVYK